MLTFMRLKQARFSIGDTVTHLLFNYRGVVVDVDPVFEGTDDWYQQMASSKPPKDEPWYHVIVDGKDLETYVAERNLSIDASGDPVNHPLLMDFFKEFRDGVYVIRDYVN